MKSKEALVVLVGAGASVQAGISSTAELTRIAKAAMPEVVAMPGTARRKGREELQRRDRVVPLADVFDHALRADFGSEYDFEVLLNAIEELEAFVGPRYYSTGRPDLDVQVLGAFAELMRRWECLNDESLLRETRLDILETVHKRVSSNSEYPLSGHIAIPARQQLERIFKALSDRYRLIVIDFNYDDLLDRIELDWRDGFTTPVPNRFCWLFSPEDWNRDVADPSVHLLMHLHGSVRYGYQPFELMLPVTARVAEPAKYDHLAGARDSLAGRGMSGTTVHGKIEDASFIVSGVGKVGKVTYNARPYGYYYRAVMDLLPRTERLLVLGYGWRDYHVNTWVNEYIGLRPQRRTAVVTLRPGKIVGDNTSQEYQSLARLADPPVWPHIETFAFARTDQEKRAGEPSRLRIEGGFAIAPEGFIMDQGDEESLLQFLTE